MNTLPPLTVLYDNEFKTYVDADTHTDHYHITSKGPSYGALIPRKFVGPFFRFSLPDQRPKAKPMSSNPLPYATSIQIGNSDDRLSQREWCDFINDMTKIMRRYRIWFSGPREARAPWQCFCWVINGQLLLDDVQALRALAAKYRQRQIAVTSGTTTMIEPEGT